MSVLFHLLEGEEATTMGTGGNSFLIQTPGTANGNSGMGLAFTAPGSNSEIVPPWVGQSWTLLGTTFRGSGWLGSIIALLVL